MGRAILKPGNRYDMPPGFGPSIAPSVETGYDLDGSAVEFETTVEALEPFLPEWFTPTARPIVSIGYRHMIGMSWMGGRNYRIVNVRVTSQCAVDGTLQNVPFCLVIWESDYAPVVAGRELMGAPKLVADIPEIAAVGENHTFVCREYESTLLRAQVMELTELPREEVARASATQRSNPISVGYWKYIPGVDGKPDANYPVGISMDTPFVRMWKGKGAVEFGAPSAKEAPYSRHIISKLAGLPRVSDVTSSAFQAKNCTLFRERTRRL